MRLLATLLLLAAPLAAIGQLVHPAGAPTVAVNWVGSSSYGGSSSPDSVALDLDGDQVTDVAFVNDGYTYYFPNDSPGLKLFFNVRTRKNSVQLATDSSNLGNAHRFQAGDLIKSGLYWNSSGTSYGYCLDYTPLNGASTGPAAGSFHDGQPGYVVVRKQLAGGSWRYWWIRAVCLNPTTNRQVQVNFYGTSLGTVLAASQAVAFTTLAYPNPSADNWLLPPGSNGPYQLFDCRGQLIAQGHFSAAYPLVEGQQLPAGMYWLEYLSKGQLVRQRLAKY